MPDQQDLSGSMGMDSSILRSHGPYGPHERKGMTTYKIGYFVASLPSTAINRMLSKALIRLAPADLE